METLLNIFKWGNWIFTALFFLLTVVGIFAASSSIGLMEIILLLIVFMIMPVPGIAIHIWQKSKKKETSR